MWKENYTSLLGYNYDRKSEEITIEDKQINKINLLEKFIISTEEDETRKEGSVRTDILPFEQPPYTRDEKKDRKWK